MNPAPPASQTAALQPPEQPGEPPEEMPEETTPPPMDSDDIPEFPSPPPPPFHEAPDSFAEQAVFRAGDQGSRYSGAPGEPPHE